jgi:hypothetical protein
MNWTLRACLLLAVVAQREEGPFANCVPLEALGQIGQRGLAPDRFWLCPTPGPVAPAVGAPPQPSLPALPWGETCTLVLASPFWRPASETAVAGVPPLPLYECGRVHVPPDEGQPDAVIFSWSAVYYATAELLLPPSPDGVSVGMVRALRQQLASLLHAPPLAVLAHALMSSAAEPMQLHLSDHVNTEEALTAAQLAGTLAEGTNLTTLVFRIVTSELGGCHSDAATCENRTVAVTVALALVGDVFQPHNFTDGATGGFTIVGASVSAYASGHRQLTGASVAAGGAASVEVAVGTVAMVLGLIVASFFGAGLLALGGDKLRRAIRARDVVLPDAPLRPPPRPPVSPGAAEEDGSTDVPVRSVAARRLRVAQVAPGVVAPNRPRTAAAPRARPPLVTIRAAGADLSAAAGVSVCGNSALSALWQCEAGVEALPHDMEGPLHPAQRPHLTLGPSRVESEGSGDLLGHASCCTTGSGVRPHSVHSRGGSGGSALQPSRGGSWWAGLSSLRSGAGSSTSSHAPHALAMQHFSIVLSPEGRLTSPAAMEDEKAVALPALGGRAWIGGAETVSLEEGHPHPQSWLSPSSGHVEDAAPADAAEGGSGTSAEEHLAAFVASLPGREREALLNADAHSRGLMIGPALDLSSIDEEGEEGLEPASSALGGASHASAAR